MFQEPDVDWVCSMLGVWRAEHTYVPLEPTQGIRRLADVAKEAKLAALLIHDPTVPLVSQLALNDAIKVVNVSTLPVSHLGKATIVSNHKPNDEAMIIYTSGSTGVPKVCGPNSGICILLSFPAAKLSRFRAFRYPTVSL